MKSNILYLKKEKKYNFVYRVTCKINGFYYYGKHSTNDLNDGYLGSSKSLKKDIKLYGKENFKLEILEHFLSSIEAYKGEKKYITKEALLDYKCYNKRPGGIGCPSGAGVYITEDNKSVRLHKDDILVQTGKVHGIAKGYSIYLINGDIKRLKTDDPRVLNGEAISFWKNKKSGMKGKKHKEETKIKMKEKAKGRTHTKDTKEALKKIGIGIGSYRKEDGSVVRLPINHPDVVSGLVVGVTKNMIPCILPDGTKKSLHKNDPLYTSGQAVHITTGMKPWNKK